MRAMGFVTRFFRQSKPLLVEALGSFLLVLVGTGALTALQLSGEGTTSSFMLVSMLAFSGVFGWLVYLLDNHQRGYFNPAITFFLWLRGSLPFVQTIVIILVQTIGAVVGSVLVALLYGPSAVDSGLGAVHVMSTMGPFAGVIAEALGMVFVLATLAKILNERVSPLRRGVMLGGALALGQFISLGVSGGALNPARALAPQLVVADARDWWVYWIGPLVGAALVWLASNWLMAGVPAHREQEASQAQSHTEDDSRVDETPQMANIQAEENEDDDNQLSLQQRARQAIGQMRHTHQQPEQPPQEQPEPEAEPQYDQLPAAPIMPSFSEEPSATAKQPTVQPQPSVQPQPQSQAEPQNQPKTAEPEPVPQPKIQPAAVRFVNFEHPADDGNEE